MNKLYSKLSFIMILALLISVGVSGTKVDAATATLNTGFVSGSATINLYSQSKTSSKVVVKIKKGEQVTNISKVSSSWYKASYGKQTGYIVASQIILDKKPNTYNGIGILKAASKAYVSANANSKSTGTLKKGTSVTITGIVGTWYQIKSGKSYEYITNKNISVSATESEKTFNGKASIKATVNVISTANSQGTKQGTFSHGDTVTIIAKTKSFYKVSYGNKKGYLLIERADLHETSKKVTNGSIVTSKKTTSVYEYPSKSSRVKGQIKLNETATIAAVTTKWYGLRANDGKVYWVEKSNVTYSGYNKSTEFSWPAINKLKSVTYFNNASIDLAIDTYEEDLKIVKLGTFADNLHTKVTDGIDIKEKLEKIISGSLSMVGVVKKEALAYFLPTFASNPFDLEDEKNAIAKLKKLKKEGKGAILTKELSFKVGKEYGLVFRTTVTEQK